MWWVEADPAQWPRLQHLLLKKCAAMDYDGEVQFHRRNVSMASSVLPLHPEERDFNGAPLSVIGTVTVPCYKLDTLFWNIVKLHLLVVDTEGAEVHVLRGATELLKRTDEVKIEWLPRLGYDYAHLLGDFTLMEKCPSHNGDWYDLRYRRT